MWRQKSFDSAAGFGEGTVDGFWKQESFNRAVRFVEGIVDDFRDGNVADWMFKTGNLYDIMIHFEYPAVIIDDCESWLTRFPGGCIGDARVKVRHSTEDLVYLCFDLIDGSSHVMFLGPDDYPDSMDWWIELLNHRCANFSKVAIALSKFYKPNDVHYNYYGEIDCDVGDEIREQITMIANGLELFICGSSVKNLADVGRELIKVSDDIPQYTFIKVSVHDLVVIIDAIKQFIESRTNPGG